MEVLKLMNRVSIIPVATSVSQYLGNS